MQKKETSPMKRVIASALVAIAALAGAAPALAQEGGPALDRFPAERVTDLSALQHGAKLFVNYCLNCHQAAFMRYNRLHDIGLSDDQIKSNLLFTGEKVGDLMKTPLDPKDAKAFFGTVPPDLSVIARSRSGPNGSGADYLYTYLRSFYRDETRPTGWNNRVFPNVGMPHVLWELQGTQRPVYEDEKGEGGEVEHVFKGFRLETPGTLSAADYNADVADLVAYLQWMSEPAQNFRVKLGVWVLIFLGVFWVICWRLNASYWKDVR
jgi:ubiquinol-cytochrome c reductase cytochrome c1 subunit